MGELRPYQADLVNRLSQSWRAGHKAPCIVLPCGGGKSVIVAEIAKRTTENGGNVLFLVHRKELCDQIRNTFRWWGVEMDLCNVMMVQTASRRIQKLTYPTLIITDENHHSKGAQGGKRSMDRASGSGVFARDPDALLDLTELELSEDIRKQETNTAICDACVEQLRRHAPAVLADASPDALLSHVEALKLCQDNLPPAVYEAFLSEIETIKRTVRQRTAWRLDGTLREFPKFEPKNLWFRYPVHVEDTVGVLKDLQSESEMHPYQRGNQKRGAKTKETYAAQKADKKAAFENAFNACNLDGTVTVQNMAEYLGVSRRTIENRIKEYDGFILKNGDIVRETSK